MELQYLRKSNSKNLHMYHVEVGRGTCVTVRVWDRDRVRVRV